jgi:hypothetical protein
MAIHLPPAQVLYRAELSKVKVKITLRLAVYRRSVRLGVKPVEIHDENFFYN